MHTLELLPSLDTRKVIRHTVVKGYNMLSPEKYANLDLIAEPDFIEVKAYMFVGYSRQRLSIENMPSHMEIKTFAAEIAEHTGYMYGGESSASRVVMLSNKRKPQKLNDLS